MATPFYPLLPFLHFLIAWTDNVKNRTQHNWFLVRLLFSFTWCSFSFSSFETSFPPSSPKIYYSGSFICCCRPSRRAAVLLQNNCDRLVSMDRDDSLYQSEAFEAVLVGVETRGDRPEICDCCCCWLATAAFNAFRAAWVAEANEVAEFPPPPPPPPPAAPAPPPPTATAAAAVDPCSWLTSSCCWDRRFAATAATAAFWCCDVGDCCCCCCCGVIPEGAGRMLSNLRVSGLYIGCLNLQWVRRLSLRV